VFASEKRGPGLIRHLNHAEGTFGASNSFELGTRDFNPLRLADLEKSEVGLLETRQLGPDKSGFGVAATILPMSLFGSW